MRWIAPTVGLLAVTLALGCISLPKPAPYNYFVLTPLEPGAAGSAPAAGREAPARPTSPVLVVGRVTLPDYLDREALAMRVGAQQLTYSQGDRWAEPLEDGLARTVRQNLGLLLEPGIRVARRGFATAPDYSVGLDVLRFERLGTRQVELWARFTVRARGAVVHEGETHLIESTTGADAGAAASALSQALGKLSQEIASAVLAVRSSAPAPSSGSGGRSPGKVERLRDAHTRRSFQRPRLKSSPPATAMVENEVVMAMNTPVGPKPTCFASTHASGISSTQEQRRFSHVGVQVSPAPLNDCPSTMPYA